MPPNELIIHFTLDIIHYQLTSLINQFLVFFFQHRLLVAASVYLKIVRGQPNAPAKHSKKRPGKNKANVTRRMHHKAAQGPDEPKPGIDNQVTTQVHFKPDTSFGLLP